MKSKSPQSMRVGSRDRRPIGAHSASSSVVWSAWGVALACSAAIAMLHVVFATHAGPLWRDEAADVSFATMPSWAEIWHHLHLDNFPPLLLVVLRAWTGMGWGATDGGYRVLGCLIGFGLLATIWIVARLCGKNVPLLGLALFGLTPYAFWFGDAIRPYGLGIILMLLTFGLMWRFLTTGSFRHFALASVAAVLSVQTLYQNAALILAVCIAGFAVCLRRGQMPRGILVLGAGALAAVSLFPYLPLIQMAGAWSFISRAGFTWTRLAAMVKQALSAGGIISVLVWALLLGGGLVIAAASFQADRKGNGSSGDSDMVLYAGLTAFLSMSLFAILLFYVGMETQPWYYLAPMAITAAALDVIFTVFKKNKPLFIWLILGLTTATALAGVSSSWAAAHTRQSNLDLIAARLDEMTAKGDMIVIDPWAFGITFQRYFRQSVAWQTIPPMADHRIHRYDLLKEQMQAKDPLRPLMSDIAETLKSGHRVWMVGDFQMPPDSQPPTALPPAPNSPYGWSEGDYQTTWSRQIGHFWGVHAQRYQILDLPITKDDNPYEIAHLVKIEGWRETSPDR
jgi:hypothetical protein